VSVVSVAKYFGDVIMPWRGIRLRYSGVCHHVALDRSWQRVYRLHGILEIDTIN